MEQTDTIYQAIFILSGFLSGDHDQSTEQVQKHIADCFAEDDPPEPIPHYNDSVLAPFRFIHPYLVEDRKLSPRVLVAHRVGYDEQTNHIIVPHYWNKRLVGWQR